MILDLLWEFKWTVLTALLVILFIVWQPFLSLVAALVLIGAVMLTALTLASTNEWDL